MATCNQQTITYEKEWGASTRTLISNSLLRASDNTVDVTHRASRLYASAPSVFPAPANLHTFRCLAYTALAGQCSVPVYGRPYFANASLDLYPASIHFSHPGPFSRLHKFSIVSSPGSHPSPSHQHDFAFPTSSAPRIALITAALRSNSVTLRRFVFFFLQTEFFFFFPLFRPHGAYSAW